MTTQQPHTLTPQSRKLLIIANLVMLVMIIVHDMDHVRQAQNWCYQIPDWLWILNVIVYVPNSVGLMMGLLRHRASPLVTMVSGVLIAFEFAKLHLWKPTIAVWGIWDKNFFELGADAQSWTILALTVFVGVAVSMTGAYATGLEHERRRGSQAGC